MKIVRIELWLCLVLLTAACASLPGRGGATKSETVSMALARGYDLLADYDAALAGDVGDADYFRAKATRARAGAVVLPEPPAPDEPEAAQARDVLLSAREQAADKHPVIFAEAQINYDCWQERLPRGDGTAALCQDRYYKALHDLHLKGELHFTVYFNGGSDAPDQKATDTIRQAAAAFIDTPDWHMHLTGHAASEKTAQANILLSLRRAAAVRNALAQNGVDLGNIVLGAVGADGMTAQDRNSLVSRRVDIAIVPADQDHPDAGPDITKIAPQYFGDNEPDL